MLNDRMLELFRTFYPLYPQTKSQRLLCNVLLTNAIEHSNEDLRFALRGRTNHLRWLSA